MDPLFDYLNELFQKEEEKLRKLEAEIKRELAKTPPTASEFVEKLNETSIDNWSLN